MYTIDYRPELHTLEIAIIGFLTEAEVTAFATDLAAMLGKHSTLSPPSSLYDYTAAAIQTQSVIACFQEIARRVKPGRRIALYADGPLARMQARRIAGECPTMETFGSRADAIAWLQAEFAEDAAA